MDGTREFAQFVVALDSSPSRRTITLSEIIARAKESLTEKPVSPEMREAIARAIYECGAYGGKGRGTDPPTPWEEDAPGHLEFDREQHRLMADAVIGVLHG